MTIEEIDAELKRRGFDPSTGKDIPPKKMPSERRREEVVKGDLIQSAMGAAMGAMGISPDMMKSGTKALERISPMIPGIGELAQVARPSELVKATKAGKRAFPEAAGVIAEELGKRGIDPELAAGLATPVAIAPEIASSILGLGGMRTGTSTVARAIRTKPRDLGPVFQAGEKAAGISGDLPIQRGAVARFPIQERLAATKQPTPISPAQATPSVAPISYPKDPAAFINFANGRIRSFGKKLTPQEIDDTKTILTNMINEGKVARGTEPFALATKLRQEVTKLHNQVIPGREELNRVYSLSKKIHPDIGGWIADGLKRYGKDVVKAAIVATGVGAGVGLGIRQRR